MKLKSLIVACGLLTALTGPLALAQVRHSAAWYRAHPRRHNAAWYRAHPGARHTAAWYRAHPKARRTAAWYRAHPRAK